MMIRERLNGHNHRSKEREWINKKKHQEGQ
jgi:hypothetical protein